MATKSAKITPQHLEEAKALRSLWENRPHGTQADFGEKFHIGNQAAVANFLNGRSALSMKAAIGFAQGLDCGIAEFSPRLATEASRIASVGIGASPSASPAAGDDVIIFPHESIAPWAAGGPPPDTIEIRQFRTGGAMGAGLQLRDQPGVIRSWAVSGEWLQRNVRGYTAAKNLCIVTGFGDSMRPMYNPGDPLLVDIGVHAVEFDAVYFFRVGDEGFIKRLQRIPGQGLMAISENKAYRDWVIDSSMDFEVFGRILKVWRSEEF
jgi:hypothetical protein